MRREDKAAREVWRLEGRLSAAKKPLLEEQAESEVESWQKETYAAGAAGARVAVAGAAVAGAGRHLGRSLVVELFVETVVVEVLIVGFRG